MSITGIIHPDRIRKNTGIRDGDAIVLTKSLGTGIIGTAVKAGIADKSITKPFVNSMLALNERPSEIAAGYSIHACTDVTGFGLAGHLMEMLGDDALEITVAAAGLPALPGTRDYSETGLVPAGLYRNRDYTAMKCRVSREIPQYLADLIFDPQTSGGLILSLPEGEAGKLVSELHAANIRDAGIIGTVKKAEQPLINVV